MKDIRFRAKRDTGEWVEGSLFVPDLPTTPTQICMGTNIVRISYDVMPETVGQFTGLTDKNGTKIFEGDILKLGGDNLPHWHEEGDVVEVYYVGGAFEPLGDYDSDCGTAVVARFCEVIGNIHDNPELLKEAKGK